MRNGTTRPVWILLSIVALTVAGLATILAVYIGDANPTTERTLTLIGAILAFIAPTIAALLALLRADEAKQETHHISDKLSEAHQENIQRLDTIEKKMNGVSQ